MKFEISLNEPVITSSYILDEKLPILYVSHDFDEESAGGGYWQFHCGNGDYSPEKLKLVKLSVIIRIDSSINEIADLPLGFGAWRSALGQPWQYEKEN